MDAYSRQALLLIRGSQFSADDIDICYLMDSLRECQSLPRRWGTQPSADDMPRIERVRRALDQGRCELGADTSFEELQDEVEVHASGFLAPLIKTLEVWWDAEALRDGVVLVDLPGVGVANDEYRLVTADWIRRARAVVLVVDRAGVTEASADLLRTTGFLNSLLHDTGDPDAEPPVLIIAAVKLDLVATSDWSSERERMGPDRARKWLEHFELVCTKMTEVIRGQVQQELDKIVDAGPEATHAARHEVMRQVLQTLQIHPVSAWEYRKLLREDDEDRPRILKVEDSRVPWLAEALQRVGREHAQRTAERHRRALQDARERARATLQLVLEQWREGARADEEAAKLRQELEDFAQPLKRELLVRHGQFYEFLRESMPREIRSRTDALSHEAEKDIAKYLRHYEKYHWATLRAAIRKGGTFAGTKHVDLPNELTLRFEEPVAVIWSKELLVQLRKRTRDLANDHVRLVGEILEWARRQGARVRPQIIESLHDDLKAQAHGLSGVGKEAIDELRERVKQELYAHVEGEVRKQCNKFIVSKRDVGTGTKNRILEFLRNELAEAVVAAARPAALRVLETNYRIVEREIVGAFQKVPDPVGTSVEAIAAAYGDTIKRSDAQKRRGVLEDGERLLSMLQLQQMT